MVDNRNVNDGGPVRDTTVVHERGGVNKLAIALIAIAVIVGLLFATGFWSADVKDGALPEVSVQGGALPKVDLDSKEVVVGTTKAEIDVPKIKTEKEEISVPVVGVRDGETDEKKKALSHNRSGALPHGTGPFFVDQAANAAGSSA